MGNERILVVEDEDSVSKTLTALLEFRGYQNVQVANNGHEGVTKYKATKPSIVLMDLEMPVMNGYDSSREIKKYDPTAKILLITANPQSPFAQKIIEEGYASQILCKPFSLEELLEAIENSLSPVSLLLEP
ncbi:MAG: response regulator [Proteobacteria bacterium]|nr:response regulator [Pseudomonadota bacterium]